MSGTVVFNSLGNAPGGSSAIGGGVGANAQSFTTASGTARLADVKLLLNDATPSDGGTITVTLWSNNNTNLGSELETVGTIHDSSLTSSNVTIDLPVSGGPVLTADTRYWIEVTGSSGSAAQWEYSEDTTDGTGVVTGDVIVAGTEGTDAASLPWEASITTDAACFAAGTRVRTARGEVPVEALRPGDLVVSARAGGRLAPVRWIGRRRLSPTRHPRPWDVNPVRVRAGALGPGQPARDLLLSPDHSLFLDGVLIRARDLLNGATVVQETAENITYYHVELDRHDLLFAEGLPAESFLDTGNRAAFENGGTVVMAHPDFARRVWERDACAPLLWQGPALAAVRAHLAARAGQIGWVLTDQPDLHLIARGRPLRPSAQGEALAFDLPAGLEAVCLRSRGSVPAQVLPDTSDTRRLGVAVTALALDGAALALDGHALGPGWLPPEPGLRWTDGAATLRVNGARRLEMCVPSLLRYWIAPARLAVAEQPAA